MHNLKEIRKNFDDFKDALKGRFLKIDFNELKDLDIQNRSGPNKKETDDEDIKKLFKKMVKQRAESIEIYKKNNASLNEKEINIKIDLRNKARADKDYKEADRIRDELNDKGVLIEDKDGKTLWKFK